MTEKRGQLVVGMTDEYSAATDGSVGTFTFRLQSGRELRLSARRLVIAQLIRNLEQLASVLQQGAARQREPDAIGILVTEEDLDPIEDIQVTAINQGAALVLKLRTLSGSTRQLSIATRKIDPLCRQLLEVAQAAQALGPPRSAPH